VTSRGDGTWEVQTCSRVGVVLGDGELRVTPLIRVPRLMFLLAYARDQSGWKRLAAGFEAARDVVSALASGFSWHALWALERGVLRGYLRIEEARLDVRGRIALGRQIARGGGLPAPVHVEFDDFTENILENQMLLTAARLLLRYPTIPADARKRLSRVQATLELVEPLPAWQGIKAPPITRLNESYAHALRLAELILASTSLRTAAGSTTSTTFVFDMNKVFEDFVTAAFRSAMRKYGGTVRDQVTPYSLDEDGLLDLKPDLSWWTGSTCRAVLDAKHKAIDSGLMRHPDAYQMLAYCVAYGLPRGYLLYAKDSGAEPRVHLVRNLDCEIVVVPIDVEQEPELVLEQVDVLAARVSADAAIRSAA